MAQEAGYPTNLVEAALLIDGKYTGDGRLVEPLLRIGRVNLGVIDGKNSHEVAQILCIAVNVLGEKFKDVRAPKVRGVEVRKALGEAAQMPGIRQ